MNLQKKATHRKTNYAIVLICNSEVDIYFAKVILDKKLSDLIFSSCRKDQMHFKTEIFKF